MSKQTTELATLEEVLDAITGFILPDEAIRAYVTLRSVTHREHPEERTTYIKVWYSTDLRPIENITWNQEWQGRTEDYRWKEEGQTPQRNKEVREELDRCKRIEWIHGGHSDNAEFSAINRNYRFVRGKTK